MAKYIIKRVIAAILTIWVLITIVFFLVRLMPGDPFTSAKLTDEVRANMEAYYGFDKPMIVQYGIYMVNLLHGDFGYSMKYTNKTVNDIIGRHSRSPRISVSVPFFWRFPSVLYSESFPRNRERSLISSVLS